MKLIPSGRIPVRRPRAADPVRAPLRLARHPVLRACGRALIEIVSPSRCVDCGTSIEFAEARPDPDWPFCVRCTRALPLWRIVDGCPRCGTGIGFESRLDRGAPAGRLENEVLLFGTGSTRHDRACPGCLSRGSALHRCHTRLRYEGSVRRWIPAFKNPTSAFGPSASVARALEQLSRELALRLRPVLDGQLDLLVCIPLHPARRRRRGFNHVDPIARQLARALDLPWRPRLLARTRDTRPQASLAGPSRTLNVRGAFRVREPGVRDLRIGLVDDVLTTGSTLEAAAEALLEAGAFEVRALTLAATLPTPPRVAHRQDDRLADRSTVAGAARDRTLCSVGFREAPSTGP